MRSSDPILFFSKKEKEKILAAIRQAEKETSGEIRIHLAKKEKREVLEEAKEIFEKIGMAKTRHRNGILIFLLTQSRRFALLGDQGIHKKVPEKFWEETAQKMAKTFRQDHFADGIVEAILTTGEKLKTYFPREAGDRNELSDRISYSL